MTQNERDNLLLDLKKGQDELIGRVGNLENKVENVEDEVGTFKNEVGKLESKLVNLQKGQNETNEELRKLSQVVAKIEQEHGEKLQILLDVVTSHSKKFDSIDQRFESIDNIIDRHSHEIYYLNSKVQAF